MSTVVVLGERFAFQEVTQALGGHARLYRGTDLLDQSPIAVKMFAPPTPASGDVLMRSWSNEIEGYKSLSGHRNLAELRDFGFHGEVPYIIFEWCDGDLFAYLEKNPVASWDEFWPIASDVLQGLDVIHARNFVHRDLKMENILWSESGFKIADLGTMRTREVADWGRTMADLGTRPYSPPERGSSSPTPAYDVYSFAVLCVLALTDSRATEHQDVLAALEMVNAPATVIEILTSCLAENPEDRPRTAGSLHSRLVMASATTDGEAVADDLYLDLTAGALEQYRGVISSSSATSSDLVEDLRSVGAFQLGKSKDDSLLIRVTGRSVAALLAPHKKYQGVLAVISVYKPPQRLLDLAHREWPRPTFVWRNSTLVPDRERSARAIDDLVQRLAEHEANALVDSATESRGDVWRRVLRAKRAVASRPGSDVTYTSCRINGQRLTFRGVEGETPPVGELRLVRVNGRRVLRGEVESSTPGELVLYVTQGRPDDVPRRGVLVVDAELTKSKLFREERALERAMHEKSLRPDLLGLLLDPIQNRPAGAEDSVQFIQPNLDETKRLAVSSALAGKDVTAVEGPPGTGKTTFIAELVAQALRKDPNQKVLLAAQTHIALDHAVEKVQALAPQASFLRIGAADKFRDSMEPWAVPAQMAAWKSSAEAAIERRLNAFKEAKGLHHGELSAADLSSEIVALRDRLASLADTERLHQEAASEAQIEVDELEASGAEFLEMLARLEAGIESESDGLRALPEAIERGMSIALDLERRSAESTARLTNLLEAVDEVRQQRGDAQSRMEDRIDRLRAEIPNAEGLSVDDLIDQASTYKSRDSERLQKMRSLGEDWIQRFGTDREFETILLSRAQVVATTCVALTGIPGAEVVPFGLCVVDEASKATPTELLVPMTSAASWTLVGDHRQLPPFAEAGLSEAPILEKFDLDRADIDFNLFQYLVENLPASNVITLDHQHRMHPVIGELVSSVFYGGALTSAPRESPSFITTALGGNVVWADTARLKGRGESRVGSSWNNQLEARVIVAMLKRLQWLNKDQRETSVAVLAGYVPQVKALETAIAALGGALSSLRVQVATIDSYQGQEADVVLLSLTRSNPKRDLGFLGSDARLNVALSRARDSVVLVGDSAMAASAGSHRNRSLARVLNYARTSAGCAVAEASV